MSVGLLGLVVLELEVCHDGCINRGRVGEGGCWQMIVVVVLVVSLDCCGDCRERD